MAPIGKMHPDFAGVDFLTDVLVHMISHVASMIKPLELSTFQLMEVRRPWCPMWGALKTELFFQDWCSVPLAHSELPTVA